MTLFIELHKVVVPRVYCAHVAVACSTVCDASDMVEGVDAVSWFSLAKITSNNCLPADSHTSPVGL